MVNVSTQVLLRNRVSYQNDITTSVKIAMVEKKSNARMSIAHSHLNVYPKKLQFIIILTVVYLLVE